MDGTWKVRLDRQGHHHDKLEKESDLKAWSLDDIELLLYHHQYVSLDGESTQVHVTSGMGAIHPPVSAMHINSWNRATRRRRSTARTRSSRDILARMKLKAHARQLVGEMRIQASVCHKIEMEEVELLGVSVRRLGNLINCGR